MSRPLTNYHCNVQRRPSHCGAVHSQVKEEDYAQCILFGPHSPTINIKRERTIEHVHTNVNERLLVRSPKVFRRSVPLIRKSKSMLRVILSSLFSKQLHEI